MVRIINIDQTYDFQLTGNYSNYVIAMNSYPKDVLPTFHITPQISSGSVTISEFKLFKLTINGNIVTQIDSSEIILNTSWIEKDSGTVFDSFYFEATQDFSSLGLFEGIGRFYIKDSDDNEYVSDIFCLNQVLTLSDGRAHSSGFSGGFS